MMKNVILLLCIFSVCFGGKWEKLERAPGNVLLPVRFALNQRNLDILEATLLDVSDPYSANYGKWWTNAAVLDLVAPPSPVSQLVSSFLQKVGAKEIENLRDVVKCKMLVSDLESLLQTEFHYFVHKKAGKEIIRASQRYTIPSEIAEYVAFVSGISEFPEPKIKNTPKAKEVGAVDPGYVTVAHIQEIYNIPSTWPNHPNSSLAVIEFQDDDAYLQDDLDLFISSMGIPQFVVSHIVGPFNNLTADAESTLDVQYGGAIALNATLWFWTEEDWMYEFATDLLNTNNPPLVVSMSWGWPEPNQCEIDPAQCNPITSLQYVDRVNVEFQKIGLLGITLVAASGDQGAPGDGDYNCENRTNPLSAIFPGASPWVLSVGATMLNSATSKRGALATPPICNQVTCATSLSEEVCSYPDALITSGGGFSQRSPRPSFQQNQVDNYINSATNLPSFSYFNSSNRGFPDIAALGHNYLIGYNEEMIQVDGTSCSSPVVAAIFTLLNSYRLNNNKAPLGYVVPLVYAAQLADSTTFTDITIGDNRCTESCCILGFDAAVGWDPTTGLGTPQFPKLLSYVQNLAN